MSLKPLKKTASCQLSTVNGNISPADQRIQICQRALTDLKMEVVTMSTGKSWEAAAGWLPACSECGLPAEIIMTGYVYNPSAKEQSPAPPSSGTMTEGEVLAIVEAVYGTAPFIALCSFHALQLARKILEDLCDVAGDRHG